MECKQNLYDLTVEECEVPCQNGQAVFYRSNSIYRTSLSESSISSQDRRRFLTDSTRVNTGTVNLQKRNDNLEPKMSQPQPFMTLNFGAFAENFKTK